jgi:hypothetical protein
MVEHAQRASAPRFRSRSLADEVMAALLARTGRPSRSSLPTAGTSVPPTRGGSADRAPHEHLPAGRRALVLRQIAPVDAPSRRGDVCRPISMPLRAVTRSVVALTYSAVATGGCHCEVEWEADGSGYGPWQRPAAPRADGTRSCSLTHGPEQPFHDLLAIRLIHGRLQALRELDRIVGGYLIVACWRPRGSHISRAPG